MNALIFAKRKSGITGAKLGKDKIFEVRKYYAMILL
jgi:hypothetical protein